MDMTGTVSRALALVFLAAITGVGCSGPSQGRPPGAASAGASAGVAPGGTSPAGVGVAGPRIEFPSYGISVPVPAGYVRDTDSMNSVVIFVPPGRVNSSPGRTVMVDQMPKGPSSLRQHAETMA